MSEDLIAHADGGTGDLEAGIAALFALPADAPRRSALAAGLIGEVLRAGGAAGGLPDQVRHLDRLMEIADQDPPHTPQWPALRAVSRAMVLTWAAAEGRLTDPQAASAEVEALGEQFAESRYAPLFASARLALRYAAGVAEGDRGALSDAVDGIAGLRADPRFTARTATDPHADVLAKAAAVMSANENGGDVAQALRDLEAAADRLPPGHSLRATVHRATSMLSAVTGGPPERVAQATAMAADPTLSDADRALYQAGLAVSALETETDPARMDPAVEDLRAAVALVGRDDPRLPFFLTGLALGLYRRSEVTQRAADLDEAAELLSRARDLAAGPQHPQWQMINEMLADIRARRGGTSDPHLLAVEGLRAYLWKVMIQTDLKRATAAVRDAARDAVDISRRCLGAMDPAAAIRALDSGRGLALFAATEVHTVADRLMEAGLGDLADRWRAAAATGDPARLPAGLRHEVMTVLTRTSAAAALLDPPTLPEIQNALRTVDADALVYLVPGEPGLTGYGVIAPAAGPPSYLGLPNLIPRDDDVEQYLRAAGDKELEASLDGLCDWAWRAAIGPLINTYLPRLTRAPGRVPRIVLVPMGDLARIPWQAARGGDGTYTIQHLAISQAASARMLCHSAALPPVPVTPAGLVLGDPERPAEARLGNARLEAYAIQRTFYPGARYLGRRPDGSVSPSGAGTREDLRRWLTSRTAGSGTMMHLACHAHTEPGRSYLALAGDAELRAEEVIGLLGAAPEHTIALIVLAACRSGVALNGYDEAYSLGSAFLAGGARSILTTQWEVPDRVTSRLMYMFHHYLVVQHLPAWEALRQAQLWMLDRDRRLPDGAPHQLGTRRSAAAHRVVAWAAFTHWGQ
jgi:hypothetical protein